MYKKPDAPKATWFERMIALLIIVYILGFFSGFAVHDRILLPFPEHTVWKSFLLH